MATPGQILLKSAGDASEVIGLDPATGAFERIRADESSESRGRAPQGFGRLFDGQLAAIYSLGGDLLLRAGKQTWSLRSPRVKLHWPQSDDGSKNTFPTTVAGP